MSGFANGIFAKRHVLSNYLRVNNIITCVTWVESYTFTQQSAIHLNKVEQDPMS